jgi:lipopolysaccharide export system protein LptA
MRNRIVARRGAGAAAAAIALASVLASSAPNAETGDRDKPISFAGDTGDANLQARGGALAGNVIITQGTLSIRADRIVFKQNADNSLSAPPTAIPSPSGRSVTESRSTTKATPSASSTTARRSWSSSSIARS